MCHLFFVSSVIPSNNYYNYTKTDIKIIETDIKIIGRSVDESTRLPSNELKREFFDVFSTLA